MGDVGSGSVALSNWYPRYLNLLPDLVDVPNPSEKNTSLGLTPPPILLDSMEDGEMGATAVHMCRTIYVPPPFMPVLLDRKLSPSKTWQRLWGALSKANLEADCLIGLVIDKDDYKQHYCAKFSTLTKPAVYNKKIMKNATNAVQTKAEAVHTSKIAYYLLFADVKCETRDFILAVVEDTRFC